jgi:hypothetical protein
MNDDLVARLPQDLRELAVVRATRIRAHAHQTTEWMAAARLDALESERDRAIEAEARERTEHDDLRTEYLKRIAELEARQWPHPTDPETQRAMAAGAEALKRVAVLEAALRPFAVAHKPMLDNWNCDTFVVASCGSTKITVADLGAARTALTGGHHADRG